MTSRKLATKAMLIVTLVIASFVLAMVLAPESPRGGNVAAMVRDGPEMIISSEAISENPNLVGVALTWPAPPGAVLVCETGLVIEAGNAGLVIGTFNMNDLYDVSDYGYYMNATLIGNIKENSRTYGLRNMLGYVMLTEKRYIGGVPGHSAHPI